VATAAGLAGMEDKLTGTLSGALQQRLALGCAVLHEPPILFLDEPTSGVDPISRRAFWKLIRDMASRGVTILITTHFMDEAEFCGRIGFIDAGRLIALDTPAALKRIAVPGDLFEVDVAVMRGARESAERAAGVDACACFGPRLHVFCRGGVHNLNTLATALDAAGVRPLAVRAVAPTLEDAFVRMAGSTVATGSAA